MKFEVWTEGYVISGNSAGAKLLGVVEAETFADACGKICSDPSWQKTNGNFDRGRLTVWGCRLFDNEADARKAYG